jgi:3-methylfumaryl-CoA hydratase
VSSAALRPIDLGVPEEMTSGVPAEIARQVAAAIDSRISIEAGQALPPLWHWAYFTPTALTSGLGVDGHPALPQDGATYGLPRRMWAGGRLAFPGELVPGKPAVRHSRVVSHERKSGRTGDLLVVSLEHRIDQDGATAIIEEQDLIYRADGPAIALPAGDYRPQLPESGWIEERQVGPVQLFRFSAVTFNSHRIHYDRDYATGVEGYPELVVHGPLTALLLAEFVREKTGRSLRNFEFRASAPLFAGLPWTIVAELDSDTVKMEAVRNDCQIALSAAALLTETLSE